MLVEGGGGGMLKTKKSIIKKIISLKFALFFSVQGFCSCKVSTTQLIQ